MKPFIENWIILNFLFFIFWWETKQSLLSDSKVIVQSSQGGRASKRVALDYFKRNIKAYFVTLHEQ